MSLRTHALYSSEPNSPVSCSGKGRDRMYIQADERIGKIFKTVLEIPSLPAAVEKLVLLSDKEATSRDFAAIIENDQGLAAKVLRLANNAFYALPTATSSLRHACSLIGTKTLKSLALSFGVVNLFRKACDGLDPLVFWRHAICVAIASKSLAKYWDPEREEELYIAGLLHDAGVTILAQHVEDYRVVLKHARTNQVSLSEVERGVHAISHAEVAWGLATRWRLPAVVCDAIRFHETLPGDWVLSSPNHTLPVAIVQFADHLAARVGLDFVGAPRAGKSELSIPTGVQISTEELQRLISSLPQDVAERERLICGDEAGEAVPLVPSGISV